MHVNTEHNYCTILMTHAAQGSVRAGLISHELHTHAHVPDAVPPMAPPTPAKFPGGSMSLIHRSFAPDKG